MLKAQPGHSGPIFGLDPLPSFFSDCDGRFVIVCIEGALLTLVPCSSSSAICTKLFVIASWIKIVQARIRHPFTVPSILIYCLLNVLEKGTKERAVSAFAFSEHIKV